MKPHWPSSLHRSIIYVTDCFFIMMLLTLGGTSNNTRETLLQRVFSSQLTFSQSLVHSVSLASSGCSHWEPPFHPLVSVYRKKSCSGILSRVPYRRGRLRIPYRERRYGRPPKRPTWRRPACPPRSRATPPPPPGTTSGRGRRGERRGEPAGQRKLPGGRPPSLTERAPGRPAASGMVTVRRADETRS